MEDSYDPKWWMATTPYPDQQVGWVVGCDPAFEWKQLYSTITVSTTGESNVSKPREENLPTVWEVVAFELPSDTMPGKILSFKSGALPFYTLATDKPSAVAIASTDLGEGFDPDRLKVLARPFGG